MTRRRVGIALAVLVVAGAVLAWWWRGRDAESRVGVADDAAARDSESDEALEWLVGPDPLAGEPPRGDRGPRGWGDGTPGSPGGEGRRGRRRWAADGGLPRLSPEQRREWARRRVEIVALGATPPTIEPEVVLEAMREQRQQMRECVQTAGGWQALGGASDGGPRSRRSVTFEIGASGSVTPGSASFAPGMPPALASCMRAAVEQIQVPSPGPDGARVTVSMGGRGPRGDGPRGGASLPPPQ